MHFLQEVAETAEAGLEAEEVDRGGREKERENKQEWIAEADHFQVEFGRIPRATEKDEDRATPECGECDEAT